MSHLKLTSRSVKSTMFTPQPLWSLGKDGSLNYFILRRASRLRMSTVHLYPQ